MATVLSGTSGALYYKPAGTKGTFGTANVVIGTETITIGKFLDSGIVSEKIKNEMPDYHEDYLVYPTIKALINRVNSESKE